jgi:hypothetical protein
LVTQNIDESTKITISILDAKDNSELSTKEVTIKSNKGDSEDITVENDWNNKELLVSIKKDNNTILEETYNGTKKIKISCCEHAIVKGDSGDLIKEINIRLAGFGEGGCPLPHNKFDDRTEKAVKQFQRDYMKVTPTGVICKDFLEKLDKFCEDYYIKIDTDTNFKVKCPCVDVASKSDYHCTTGFGEGRNGKDLTHIHTYDDGVVTDKTHTQIYDGTEKPGIHRSLLWAISAMRFYLDKVETSENLKIGEFNSSYRCKGDNIDKHKIYVEQEKDSKTGKMVNKKHPEPNQDKDLKNIECRTSTNHMGNAIDIYIFQNGSRPTTPTTRTETCDKIRKLFVKYCGALIRWPKKDVFCLEASKKVGSDAVATTWVHIDCREFTTSKDNPLYQDNSLYCKNETELKGSTFQSLFSSTETDSGKWINITNCNYSPEAQTTIPSRVDEIWIGILDLPTANAEKAIKCVTDGNNKQVWETTTDTSNAKKRNQCVVDILEENDTEYKVQPKGQSEEGWINKTWITEVVKFKQDTNQ